MSIPHDANRAGQIPAERRASARQMLNMVLGTIVFAEESFILDCTICDLSQSGARVMVPNPHFLPAQLILLEPKKFVAHESQVRWRRGVLMGLSFDRSFSLDEELGARHHLLRRIALDAGSEAAAHLEIAPRTCSRAACRSGWPETQMSLRRTAFLLNYLLLPDGREIAGVCAWWLVLPAMLVSAFFRIRYASIPCSCDISPGPCGRINRCERAASRSAALVPGYSRRLAPVGAGQRRAGANGDASLGLPQPAHRTNAQAHRRHRDSGMGVLRFSGRRSNRFRQRCSHRTSRGALSRHGRLPRLLQTLAERGTFSRSARRGGRSRRDLRHRLLGGDSARRRHDRPAE